MKTYTKTRMLNHPIIGGFFFLIFGWVPSLQAICPDYEVHLNYVSGPTGCNYYTYEVRVESNSSDEVKGVNLEISFLVSGGSGAFFDPNGVTGIYSWLQPDIVGSTVTYDGLVPSGTGVTFVDLSLIGTIVFCGRQPGMCDIEVNAVILNDQFDLCSPTQVVVPSITFPDAVGYSGVIQKQPLNCNNQNNGIDQVQVRMYETNNEPLYANVSTSLLGTYNFASTPGGFTSLQSQCYEICPSKGSVSFCSINTNDLNRTNAFVLGQYCPLEAWEKLAMDVSNDDQVSTKDVVIMNKIILGQFDFGEPYWKYWKFVESSQYNGMSVNCTENVPTYDECLSVTASSSVINHGWYGIIAGDADGSCTTCSFNATGTRSKSRFGAHVAAEEQKEAVFFHFYLVDDEQIWNQGLEVQFDEDRFERIEVIDQMEDDDAYVQVVIDKGHLKYHWFHTNLDKTWAGRRLFTVMAIKKTALSGEIENTVNVVDNERLNGVGIGGEVYPLDIEVIVADRRDETDQQEGIWSSFGGDLQYLSCEGDESMQVEIFDINGKRCVESIQYRCGNTLRYDLPYGVYIVRYQWGDDIYTQKVILQSYK